MIDTDPQINDELSEEPELEGSDEGELNPSGGARKVVLDKADRSLAELHRWYKAGRIIVDPEWQRNYVWDSGRASKLIESFLLEIPVPVIYMARNEATKYEVIDGLQRLTSVFNFFDNKFRLSKLDILGELNGKTYSQLPENLQHKLEDSILRSFELTDSNGDIHFIVFERLNTGGVKLNDMEIRNCLYRGSLNNLIKELALNPNFQSSMSVKHLHKRMQDRALVLRFLAFYERTHLKCNFGLKKFLNEFLDTYSNAPKEKIEEYRKVFDKCVRACFTVWGDSAFRLKSDITKPGRKSIGEWATRPNAAIFQIISTSFAHYDLAQVTERSDQIYEEYLDLIANDTLWVDRVRRATGEATRLQYTFNTWYERLKAIMNSTAKNDSQRCFSRNLKKEMFDANPTCKICGNRIALIDDAALDHDQRYWDGGKTVPENANLVHRLCNQRKG